MKRLVILSFEENKFPDPEEISWKKARIVPIYKNKGEKTSMSNYRLVALLPVLSKVLESIMVQQLYQHFEQKLPTIGNRSRRLLTERQHGYRKKMSCQSNIIQMIDDILQDCQNGDETALCISVQLLTRSSMTFS